MQISEKFILAVYDQKLFLKGFAAGVFLFLVVVFGTGSALVAFDLALLTEKAIAPGIAYYIKV